jgi:hypothetical protein
MASPYEKTAFASRVNLACSYISAGRRTSRTFDTCFEMNDGDAVAVAVYRRSRRNPKLRTNLYRYLDRATIVGAAWRNRRRPTRSLPAWAGELRRAAEEAFAAAMAKRDAEQAAERARVAAAGYTVEELPRDGYSRWRFVRPDGTVGAEQYHNDNAWYAASLDMASRVESEAA